MENLWLLIPALACPIGMGLMMLFMGKSMRRSGKPEDAPERHALAEPIAEREPVAERELATDRD